jgi:lysophospholipase L1-like esterase
MALLRLAGMAALLASLGSAAVAQSVTPPRPEAAPAATPEAAVPVPPAEIPGAAPPAPAVPPAQPTISASPVAPIVAPSPDAASDAPRIEWEVKNRFRLFRSERDFQRHAAAYRADGVLASERRLERDIGGRGWARTMVGSLCVDAAGNLNETCTRDGVAENYLAPDDHRIGAVLANAPAEATCAWSFDDGERPPQQVTLPCEEEVTLRVRYGRTTHAQVDIARSDGASDRAATDILVHDLLIAGLGDSVGSGDGNPDRAIALTDEGFCFRRFLAGAGQEYFRPGRAGYSGTKACDGSTEAQRDDWIEHGARWLSAACHRSLYGYQMRTALAIAIENAHGAVTFVPLACTGATIENGILDRQRARETACDANGRCVAAVPAQLAQLRDALAHARRRRPDRTLDLVLLTIGANDIGFSELVADVIVKSETERALFRRGGVIGTVEDAEQALNARLPVSFARLRAALKGMVGGNLAHVVYVSYGHPALQDGGSLCGGAIAGFDIHPAFAVDPPRLQRVADFVSGRFFPALKALATCESNLCQDPSSERMTFVDAHQLAFADHGFCARADTDPAFDLACFSASGESFQEDPVEAATHPLVCDRSVAEFRPYASRARWIRTPNDSYFSAMTYPEGLPASLQPSDIHDATWGLTSAVYGGAFHPTAEGHAAMADAALPAAREILGLAAPSQ